MCRSVSPNPRRNENELPTQWMGLQERDRQLMAFEIHDGFVQNATAALMHFRAFQELHDRDPAAAWKTYEAALRALREGIEEARRLMGGLRPPVLDEAGLVEAIDHLSRQAAGREGPRIEFSHAVRFDRLDPLLEMTIFRIVQESLTNACRHSQSEKVRISLRQIGDRARLEVHDWGIGFDPEKVDRTRFGLQGIRERARLLGGQATIETSPGAGTRVIVELPLKMRGEG